MDLKGKNRFGRISRRSFLKTSSILGAAAVAPGVFHILGRKAHAATNCRVLMSPTTDITPPRIKGGEGQQVASMVYDYMLRLEGPEGQLSPSLAESWEMSSDAMKWTFKLRDGVKFHHGTPFTSADVVFTAKTWQDAEKGGAMKTTFANVTDVGAPDKLTAVFTLIMPDPDFLLKLIEYNACILAHDYDYMADGNTKPSGTGAFKVKKVTPGQRVVLEKNSEYFVPGLPKVDQIEVIFIAEVQTQLMTLEAGQADIVRWLGFDSVLRYKNHPKVALQNVECANHANFYMAVDRPPFNDNRVREAVKYCVDRNIALESAAYGYGVLGDDSPVWPLNQLYTNIGFRERDIDKAKALLAEAGHQKGLDVDVYVPSNHPPLLDVALIMQQMVKPAGINLQVQGVTRDVYYGRYWLKVGCGITNWAHRENPIDLMNISLRSGVPWNESHFSNKKLDQMLDDASVEMDLVKRKTIVKNIQELLVNEGPSVIPFFYSVFGATRKGVKNWHMQRNMTHDYRFVQV